jgi:chloramphenicol 3-O phosphotransferase
MSELVRREKERKNRCLGSAESSYQYLYPKEDYDLTVDTFNMTGEECSLKIHEVMSDKPKLKYCLVEREAKV